MTIFKRHINLYPSLLGALFFIMSASAAVAQERPFFVTYDHHLEEPGNLELALNPTLGLPRDGRTFLGGWTEVEYGIRAWWTTELYLDGQATWGDGAFLTGWRWENRVRPLRDEHRVNPILYLEFEDVNAADRTLLDVLGFDSQRDQSVPNATSRQEREREIETKLILSSDFKGWNVSENLIAAKKLSPAPWEFGYAVGLTRPLALAASAKDCSFCRENLHAGVELYGGLGDGRTLSGTSHYAGLVLAWNLPSGLTLRFSPTLGLTSNSHRALFRWGISYEIPARRIFHSETR